MILTGINAMYTIVMQKIPSLIPTGINALYAVVMQGIACQYLFGKDSGLYQNLTKNQWSNIYFYPIEISQQVIRTPIANKIPTN